MLFKKLTFVTWIWAGDWDLAWSLSELFPGARRPSVRRLDGGAANPGLGSVAAGDAARSVLVLSPDAVCRRKTRLHIQDTLRENVNQ